MKYTEDCQNRRKTTSLPEQGKGKTQAFVDTTEKHFKLNQSENGRNDIEFEMETL